MAGLTMRSLLLMWKCCDCMVRESAAMSAFD
jgi:hypothetical protein